MPWLCLLHGADFLLVWVHMQAFVRFLIETDAQHQISSNLRSRLQKRFWVLYHTLNVYSHSFCCQHAITFSSKSKMWLCLPTCVDDTLCQCHQQHSVRFTFTQKHILYFSDFTEFNSTLLTIHGHNLTCSGVRICSAFLVRPVSTCLINIYKLLFTLIIKNVKSFMFIISYVFYIYLKFMKVGSY